MTREELLERARENQVKFVRLQFTDVFGQLKNIAVTVEDLDKVLAGNFSFDSSVLEGGKRNEEHDIVLFPDMDTFQVFPWRPREGAVARLICDVNNPDGSPYHGCSRQRLKAMLKRYEDLGLEVVVGTESEFFLFNVDENGVAKTITHDRGSYCDLTPVDQGENARRDMVLTLEEMGVETGGSHHESAPGQHEIIIKQDKALKSADKFVTFKFVVRTIAQRHGLHASFMPRPLKGVNGSGLHLNLSMFKLGRNVFHQEEGEGEHISGMALNFMAGVLGHARGFSAITNPLVNSYKRLVANDTAPAYMAWSYNNRNTIIRVPVVSEGSPWVEVRNPDPSCNPYLALATILAAGLDGINRGVLPPDAVRENVHQLDAAKLDRLGVQRLPQHLGEAIMEMAKDEVVKSALGDALYQRFHENKQEEWVRFLEEVHPWELDEYLIAY